MKFQRIKYLRVFLICSLFSGHTFADGDPGPETYYSDADLLVQIKDLYKAQGGKKIKSSDCASICSSRSCQDAKNLMGCILYCGNRSGIMACYEEGKKLSDSSYNLEKPGSDEQIYALDQMVERLTSPGRKKAEEILLEENDNKPYKIRSCAYSCTARTCGCSSVHRSQTCSSKKFLRLLACSLYCPTHSIKNCGKVGRSSLAENKFKTSGLHEISTSKKLIEKFLDETFREDPLNETSSFCWHTCWRSGCRDMKTAAKCMAGCPAQKIQKCLKTVKTKLESEDGYPFDSVLPSHVVDTAKREAAANQAREAFMGVFQAREKQLQGEAVKNFKSLAEAVNESILKKMVIRTKPSKRTKLKNFLQFNPESWLERTSRIVQVKNPLRSVASIAVIEPLDKVFVLDYYASTVVSIHRSNMDDKDLQRELKVPGQPIGMAAGIFAEMAEKENKLHNFNELYVSSEEGIHIFNMVTEDEKVKKIPNTTKDGTKLLNRPGPMVFDPLSGFLFVGNMGEKAEKPGKNIMAFDMRNYVKDKEDNQFSSYAPLTLEGIPVGPRPTALQLSQNGDYLYTTCAGDKKLYVIALNKVYGPDGQLSYMDPKVVSTLDTGAIPVDMSYDPQTERLFVANILDGTISVYKMHQDGGGDQFLGSLVLGADIKDQSKRPLISSVAVSRVVTKTDRTRYDDLSYLYAVDARNGKVYTLDLETLELMNTIEREEIKDAVSIALASGPLSPTLFVGTSAAEAGSTDSQKGSVVVLKAKERGNFAHNLKKIKFWFQRLPGRLFRKGKHLLISQLKHQVIHEAFIQTSARIPVLNAIPESVISAVEAGFGS